MPQPLPMTEQVQTNILQTKCTKTSLRTTTYPRCPTACLLIQTHLNQDPRTSHGPRERTVPETLFTHLAVLMISSCQQPSQTRANQVKLVI